MTEKYDKTFIAIDYGTRRIGLAKSDPTGLIASVLATLEVKSKKIALEKIREVIEAYQPNGLVVGYPILKSGDKSDKCKEIDKFVDEIKLFYDGPIFMADESHSSQEAVKIIHAHGKKTGQDKKRIDRLAAVIILQRFLENEHNGIV